MTIDTRALKALIYEAVEEYRKQLVELEDLLTSEFNGCGVLDCDLEYEIAQSSPYLRMIGCKDYPALAVITTDYTGALEARIASRDDWNDAYISPKLERALERARANAIALSAMGDMILEVVQS